MSTENLTAYLKEHAAGASAALDLLGYLIASHEGGGEELFFAQLREEITRDKATLDEILGRFGAGESALLNTMSRLAEKAARSKFLFSGPGRGELGRLEALEMLSLGIEGKRALWRALAAVAPGDPQLQSWDFSALERSAGEQRERVESKRLEAARNAFKPS